MLNPKIISYKNIVVSLTDSGKGDAVVFLHGFLENKAMWEQIAPSFENHRVITIDLLGHGHTDPIGYVQTMEDNADLVAAVLDELKIKKAILVGHSMGGYVALALAEKRPEMVRGIALLNSTAFADSDERKANRGRAIKTVKENYANFVRMSISNLFSAENRERLKPQIEAVKEQALRTPLQGIIASLEGMKIRKDREFIMAEGKIPFLLALGKKDEVLNYEDNSKLVKHPTTELVSFPDGHMSTIENTAEVISALSDFFNTVYGK